jgi:hypothetical protein
MTCTGRAAKRHQPSDFLRLKATKAFIQQLASETPGIPGVRSVEGAAGGSYVARELVYAYAMWISPASR